jgi:hypothetical protein
MYGFGMAAAGFATFVLAGPLHAADIGVIPKKLIVVDKLATASLAKVVYVAKDRTAGITKGTATDAELISVRFDVAYGNGAAAGTFDVSSGTANGWVVNSENVAKYVNRAAPAGPTEAKVAVIKPGRLLRLVGKGLGDVPVDVLGAGDPLGPVQTAFCVDNADEEHCHCSEFTGCAYRSIAGGTGAKLVCRTGTGDGACAAIRPVCGDGVVESPETCDLPATCPVGCDDADVCTTDTLVGMAATCDAACVFDPITACQDGDGCCPTGCDAMDDDDCVRFADLGLTVLDIATNLEWEKKDGADATPGAGVVDAGNLHDVDNRYSVTGRCTIQTSVFCQPNASAAATCAAQTIGGFGCVECGVGQGTCHTDILGVGAITTIWDWLNQVNAANFAGHSDWRVATSAGTVATPTGQPAELESIVDLAASGCGLGGPCIDSLFGPTVANSYWTRSTAMFPGFGFVVGFGDGSVSDPGKVSGLWVRAVRLGP